MKQEIEIKLGLDPKAVEKLLLSKFFVRLEEGNTLNRVLREKKTLSNVYYDTSDWLLHARKIALRIRTDGALFFQTLKTKGVSDKGLHKRFEWEWPLKENQLDTQLLPLEHWPADIAFDRLKAQFCTQFTRNIWLFSYRDDQGVESQIEMALDRGDVSSVQSSQRVAICELELELISGSANALHEVAGTLIAQCPELSPCDISKAEKGYQLLAQC